MLTEIDYNKIEQEMRKEICQQSDEWHNRIKAMLNNGEADETIINSLMNDDDNSIKRLQSAALNTLSSIHDVLISCANDKLTCRHILNKSVSRTGYQEKAQFTMLSKNSLSCYNWIDLPSKPDDKYIPILNGKKLKSVDFIASTTGASGRKYQVWVMAKYTSDEGGSQDNQRNDLMSFADYADTLNTSSNIIVVLLADGDYYKKKRRNFAKTGISGDFYHAMQSLHTSYGTRLIATTTGLFDTNMNALLQTM